MQDPRNLSWTQFNQARRFPLLYGATAVSRDGHFIIPDNFLTGLYISYGLDTEFVDPGGFFIGRIIYWRNGLSLEIHYGDKCVAETTMDLTSQQTVAALLGYSDRFFYGYVVIGSTTGLESCPAGEWDFDYEATVLDPFCIRPTVREISALYVKGSNPSQQLLGPFYGNVTLSEGENIALSVRSAEGLLSCLDIPPSGEGTEVVIHAKTPEADNSCVRTLQYVTPDEGGNIQIIGQECLEIIPGDATLTLNDVCSKPCCTCEELTPVEEKIKELDASVTSLRQHIDTLLLQADFLTQSFNSVR